MTEKQLKKIEAELEKRRYKRYKVGQTAGDADREWIKAFDHHEDSYGDSIAGYLIAFRVWDYTKYADIDPDLRPDNPSAYSIDLWSSSDDIDGRIDLEMNLYEPIDIDACEAICKDFREFTLKHSKQRI